MYKKLYAKLLINITDEVFEKSNKFRGFRKHLFFFIVNAKIRSMTIIALYRIMSTDSLV